MEPLVVVRPRDGERGRLDAVLTAALAGLALSWAEGPEGLDGLRGRRLLFALPLGAYGISHGCLDILERLRREPGLLEGCVGGIVAEAGGERHTKAAARELALAANDCGCAFPGRPLVELTGSLANFRVQAQRRGTDEETAVRLAVRELGERVLAFAPSKRERPRLLVLHASSHKSSNTMQLWDAVAAKLGAAVEVEEIGLRNGTLQDCSGCPYAMCLHYGEKGGCFYGGVIVEEVYPALRRCDGLVLICPNYNDALSANLTAAINRLTALYRTTDFSDKALYAVVVSGYSGGDLVAEQALGALCMNKSFYLPPRFSLLETANDPGAAMGLPGIQGRVETFARRIQEGLLTAEKPLF